MRVTVRRTGGFAGTTRTFEVDTAALPPARRAEVERLARALAAAKPAADAFAYEVTIDGEKQRGVDAAALVEAMSS